MCELRMCVVCACMCVMHACVRVRVHACVRVRMCAACVRVCMCVHVCVCVHARVCADSVYAYACANVYTSCASRRVMFL